MMQYEASHISRHPGESRDPTTSLGRWTSFIDECLIDEDSVDCWKDVLGNGGHRISMRDEKVPAVYILASKTYGTLYIGVTSDLCSRISAHKEKLVKGFTQKYNVDRLVYFEFHNSMDEAIAREKQLKEWKRLWKIQLIERDNPQWVDLYAVQCGPYAIPGQSIHGAI